MLTQDEMVGDFLEECREDHVGLWQLANAVRFDLDIRDPEEIRRRTLDVVRAVLTNPGIAIGFPAADGRDFVPWDLAPKEAVRKVAREWDELGRIAGYRRDRLV